MRASRENSAAFWPNALLVLAICSFYLWTSFPEWKPGLISARDDGYYNLLVRGFLQGHLYLDAQADPFLATLSNPWDINQRGDRGLPDSSYFQGHYYIYYGVTPAVVLFLPFRLLTGRYLAETLGTGVFACAGFVASAWIVLFLRRRYFARASGWAVAACVLALGLGDMMPVLLRRPGFREVPIACGYACCMAALAALFRALDPGRRALWLALASLAFGLAVGSRPLYLLACPVLLLPAWWEARGRSANGPDERDFSAWKGIFAATAPLGIVGAGLALYNFSRFGAVTEFGLRYQIWNQDPAKTVRFAWRFFSYDLRAFWTLPAGWSHYFPFVTFAKLPAGPAGFYGAEDPYGILPNMPFALLALGLFALRPHTAAAGDRRTPLVVAIVAWSAAAMAVPMLFFQAALNRYMVDFVPLVMLVACLGGLVLAGHARWRGKVAAAGTLLICSLAGYSAVFNVLASWRHNELFRLEHPAAYSRLAHGWNRVSYAWDRWKGTAYGPLEMKVMFPTGRVGTLEPLVVTGHEFLSDYLFVSYPGTDSIQFGLEHTSRGTFLGEPMRVVAGRAHDVRVDLGSLYPPAAHPYFDAMPAVEALLRQNTVRVTVDGRVALYDLVSTYDATGPTPALGTSEDRGPFSHPFSGRIQSAHRMPSASLEFPGWRTRPLRLKLRLPAFSEPHDEPLVAAGESGLGEVVYLHYESPTRVRFGYANGGLEGTLGPLAAVNPQDAQVVDLSFTALPNGTAIAVASRPGLLAVHLNGRLAFATPAPRLSVDPGTVALGLNINHFQPATATFTGDFLAVQPAPAGAPEPESGSCHLEVRFPPFSGVRSEPLLCAGETGQGDLVYVRYLGPDRISLGYDHWGLGGTLSAPCMINPQAVHVVEIDFGSLHPGNLAKAAIAGSGPLLVRLDGHDLLDETALFYPARPGSIVVCLNSIHASSASAGFTGELIDARREPAQR